MQIKVDAFGSNFQCYCFLRSKPGLPQPIFIQWARRMRKKPGQLNTPGAKPRGEKPEYLAPPFSKMHPLFPREEAINGVEDAFNLLSRDYPDLVTAGSKSHEAHVSSRSSYLKIREISHTYWFLKQVYEQKPMPNYGLHLSKIRGSLECLKNTLASTPPAVRSLINHYLRYSSDPSMPISKLDQTLNEFIKAIDKATVQANEKGAETTAHSGARSKNHIQSLADELLAFWSESGRDFARRFDTGNGRDSCPGDEYVSEGVEFVTKLARAIDSSLKNGEVLNALKKSPTGDK